MLDTKLILIEGLPGSGKSTTAEYLANELQKRGIASQWFHEMDDNNPIADLDCAMPEYQSKLLEEWRRFVEQRQDSDTVTILEGRFWQNSALFMYMGQYSEDDVRNLNASVAKAMQPLSPVLLNLVHDDVKTALSRLYGFRGQEWMDAMFAATAKEHWFRSRGLGGFDGWVKFFSEWIALSDKLYDALEFRKCKIRNPQDDWVKTYAAIHSFLDL